jgi:hypothetical protein
VQTLSQWIRNKPKKLVLVTQTPSDYSKAGSLTLNLLMSCIYGAPSRARNVTSYIYGPDFYWGFCFLNRAFLSYIREKPTNTPIIHSVY